MFYAWDITISANTLDSNPAKYRLHVTKGVITKIVVKYPAGCHGYVKVRINYQESQLVPLTRASWLTADDEAVKCAMYFEITSPPTFLRFVGSSPGTSYPHTLTVRVTVLPRMVASMIPVIELLTKLLSKLFGIREKVQEPVPEVEAPQEGSTRQ